VVLIDDAAEAAVPLDWSIGWGYRTEPVVGRALLETLMRQMIVDVACHGDGTGMLPRPRDHSGCVVSMAGLGGGVNGGGIDG
jgi:hypothetical protein